MQMKGTCFSVCCLVCNGLTSVVLIVHHSDLNVLFASDISTNNVELTED